MKENLLRELYVEGLQDLHSAEIQLIKALPRMAKAATSPELRAGFETHLKQTQEHVTRLEQIFEKLGESPKGKHCKGMEGLIKEGSEMIAEGLEPEELNAALISAAQHVEHYEIAGYGCVCTYAKLLGEKEAATLLAKTLDEEKQTDAKLTELAEAINIEAMEASENETSQKVSNKQKGVRRTATA